MAVHAVTEPPLVEHLPQEPGSLLGPGSECFVSALVHPEDRLHGVVQPGQRLAFVGVLGIASAIAGVDFFLGVQEKDDERQVVIELEQVEIDRINAGDPNADEVIGDVVEVLQTDNLPVKVAAGDSRHAAQDHHERLAALPRQGLPLFQ
jgi:hypothetical protein